MSQTIASRPSTQADLPQLRQAIGAALLYIAIIVAFHARILGSLTTALIGTVRDHQLIIWNAWWIRESLFHGRNPFFADMVFAPEGTPLVLHTLMPIPSAAIALLGFFVPLELAFNLVVLAAFPIAGVAAYLLCWRFTRDQVSALCGGLVFMICPFLVSKSVAGWVNLLYAGCLPLFFLALLRATDPEQPRRGSFIQLAIMTLVVLFMNEMLTVFAVNVAVFTLGWRLWTSTDRRRTCVHLMRATLPSAIVATPYLALVGYYIVTYHLPFDVERRLGYIPDVLSYVLPANATSVYSSWLAPAEPLTGPDIACYLGVLVCPLSLAGLYLRRGYREIRLCLLLFVAFLILSLGPTLLLNRQVVQVFGWPVHLPFKLWEYLPGLGAVAQSGRYLVVSYMAMAVGFASLAGFVRARLDPRRANALVLAAAIGVCLDYGFRTWVSVLPNVPPVSERSGAVLDPRVRSPYPMYYQTQHRRPLVGGCLSRVPPIPMEHYLQVPGLACVFLGFRSKDCSRDSILAGLRQLNVSDVMLWPGDWRNDLLKQQGYTQLYSDQHTVVWSVPLTD